MSLSCNVGVADRPRPTSARKCAQTEHAEFTTVTELTVKLLKPKTYFMYRQFNIQKFYVMPTQCIYVFCVDLRTNSDYFPIQH